MTLTNSQNEAISTAKRNYETVGATFDVLGESRFFPGKVVCQLTYANGSSTQVMIGKRGSFKWK